MTRPIAPPQVVRVYIMYSDNPAVTVGTYDSIAHVDAMLAHAFAAMPPPESQPFPMIDAAVQWSDGHEQRPRIVATAQLVRDAQADGGVLRHVLLRRARLDAAGTPYRGWHPERIAWHQEEGRALLRRLDADLRPNTGPWSWPSLLPDPAAAVARLREHFADRRETRRAVGHWGHNERASYLVTTHADVRYVTNFISLALRNDLSLLGPTARGVIWNHWIGVKDTVEVMLRAGEDDHEYADNEGLWTRQLPALVRLLDDAIEEGGSLRNGRLTFRTVGRRGEPYPTWVADLRGRSGVYAIRAPGDAGAREIVYVGSSSANRLHETLTRHFQLVRHEAQEVPMT